MINLQIQGIEDLVAFVAIIKGKDLDTEEIQKITAAVNKDTNSLREAVDSQGGLTSAKPSARRFEGGSNS